MKFAAGFPVRSIQACLDFAGIELADLDAVLPANRHHFLPRLAPRVLPETEHDYFGPQHKAWLYLQHAVSRGGALAWATEALSRVLLRRRFPRLLDFVDHHTAHAHSAWLTSGWDDCVALTADNMGDGWSARVFGCSGGRATFRYGSTARHSPGQFYGEIAQLLGYHNLMAGKVTGLAAHGNPQPCYAIMEGLFGLDDDERSFVTPSLLWRSRKRPPYDELLRHSPADVAAAAQKRLEDVMVAGVRRAVRESGHSSAVLAGGVFANVVVNQRILALPEVERVYVHPAMTDQGISMGAGLCWLAENGGVVNRPLESIYLGPGYSEHQMGEALEAARLPWERPVDLADTVAAALQEGRVVASYDGRLEYGPRALGNRSILYRSDDPAVNVWLNKMLRRTEFMPFAPVTLADHAAERYLGLAGGELAMRYMTMTSRVTDLLRAESPGVVHLDGTARPQLVAEADNPDYHAILQAFHRRTGVPTLINTSFNMHGEPIVCTPQDAVRAFQASGIERMVLGPFWVRNPVPARRPG